MEMDWSVWIGKKVFLRTNRGYIYSGIVKDVESDKQGLILITLTDKFDKLVCFSSGEILEIREERY